MSLLRFINQETILKLNDPQYGQLYTDVDLSILDEIQLIPNDVNLLNNQISEVHIYSFYGDYILGNHNAGYATYHDQTKSLLFDMSKVFRDANIQRGSYIVALNLFQQVWGSFDQQKVILHEISPDRTELKFTVDKKYISEINQFKTYVNGLIQNDILNGLVVNFGYNKIQKITNIRFEPTNESIFYVKLYQPLFDDVVERNTAWFGFEVVDPYIDTVVLTNPLSLGQTNIMRGPNFYLDTTAFTSNATSFKNWEDLLDSDLPTTQQIIENSLSGSGVRLNIDFTAFENFIFYSSAEERARNFHYKISKLEEYNGSVAALGSSSAVNTYYVSGAIDQTQKRIDGITSTFDPWERWMYYESTSSIFTHDLSGSLKPYPKYISGSRWVNHPLSASIVETWYDTLIYSASAYDEDNVNRLYYAVPEHLVMDPGNDDFVTFVDMVGQHFDVMYGYVKALTKIHERDESPHRGFSNDLSYYIGKSFGWQLQNTRQLSDLWKYKLGTNESGQLLSGTGSFTNISHENQTQQIWRRIVNNLPYLLKTKGTQRSVKAMMSIYGIPQTLISIKEYGGQSLDGYRPSLVEDKFSYKLHFSGSQYIEFMRLPLPVGSGSWGGNHRVPDTLEFRFQTNYSSSVSMSLWSILDVSTSYCQLELVHSNAHTTGNANTKYSGSYSYGYLRYSMVETSGSSYVLSVSSSYLPLYDNDFWTVRLWNDVPFLGLSSEATGGFRLNIDVARASDNLYGRIVHTSSFYFTSSVDNSRNRFGANENNTNNNTNRYKICLGGHPSFWSGGNTRDTQRFIGNMQGYKEYFTTYRTDIFHEHVLNPASYHDDTDTGSFYTLHRYFPLGLDTQKYDHSTYNFVSSSHPNQKASAFTTASFIGFNTSSQSDQYLPHSETTYVFAPTIGGNTLHSEKIRLEDSVLMGTLNNQKKVSVGSFDGSTFDTNRLAIVFSPTDQVNNEISNHAGYYELDDYIGDPEYEWETEYSELRRYSEQYFQKYQQRVDLNAFIRIFSVYDYSFFEQIRQLVPARADYIPGVLVEDDNLHRNKIVLAKRPVVTEPFYEDTINTDFITSSMQYQYLETSASDFYDVQYEYLYKTGSIETFEEVNYEYQYLTGSIPFPPEVCITAPHHPDTGSIRTGLCGVLDVIPTRYSGSQCPTMSIYQQMPIDCCYKKVIYHYSASGQFSTPYLKKWYTAVSKSYGMYYSRSLDCAGYQIDECGQRNKGRFVGSKLTGAGINIDSSDTIDGGPVITITINNSQALYYDDGIIGNLRVE